MFNTRPHWAYMSFQKNMWYMLFRLHIYKDMLRTKLIQVNRISDSGKKQWHVGTKCGLYTQRKQLLAYSIIL